MILLLSSLLYFGGWFHRNVDIFSFPYFNPVFYPLPDYEEHKERIFCLKGAENERGDLLGFNWGTRSRSNLEEAYFYVIVKPEYRTHGAGRLLFADLSRAADEAGVKKLQISVRDVDLSHRAFAERRGFKERKHLIGMRLDLETFDDQSYDGIIEKLKSGGFQFTSMGALGNTEEAQRKLYALNDMTASETMGSEGDHPWLSFEDFQKLVCQADWYHPDGQILVIDSSNGEWVALSAITRFEGSDYAYNLFTGVDKRYRGRKFGQAVKVHALRFARDVLQMKTAQTHHSTLNAPMIAIDRKFGFELSPGTFSMEKKQEVKSD